MKLRSRPELEERGRENKDKRREAIFASPYTFPFTPSTHVILSPGLLLVSLCFYDQISGKGAIEEFNGRWVRGSGAP